MSESRPPDSTRTTEASAEERPYGALPNRDTEDMHSGEWARMRDLDAEASLPLPEALRAVRDRIVETFGDAETFAFRGELTVIVPPERIVDVLRFCHDDDALRCEMLIDLTCVHWPAGKRIENAQETTGWPNYTFEEPGRMHVDYIVQSLSRRHRFRLRAVLPDVEPHLPSAGGVYASAAWMECEAYDFFGVRFDGHPDLHRLHMPEDWDGHPLRKDYPLGGVDVEYKGALVPPPDTRQY